MKLLVFSVFDDKAQVYGNPVFVNSRGVAIRSFADAVEDKNTSFAKHPSDFKLYLLGEFDNVSGKMDSLNTPEFVSHAVEFVKE